MTELLGIIVVCAIAYRIAFSTGKSPVFVSQSPAQPEKQATPDAPSIASVRKRLAADEKLTPELKAAFDLIQAALEAK